MVDTQGNYQKELPEHHIQQELCTTRPLYRQGRKLTAVKVYTINNESQHLLLYGVPELKLENELKSSCLKYGELKNFALVKEYPLEQFTVCYHAHFKRIQSARIAKRFLDNKPFYGGHLHVCYAPEYETLSETRQKLKQRQRDVVSRIQPGPTLLEYVNCETRPSTSQEGRKRKHPAIPITDKRLKTENQNIWEGIPKDIDPRERDPFCKLGAVGMRKHFQLPNMKPMYGPDKVNVNNLNCTATSETVQDMKQTNLMPSTVIKNNKEEYNKRIVFRKKLNKKE